MNGVFMMFDLCRSEWFKWVRGFLYENGSSLVSYGVLFSMKKYEFEEDNECQRMKNMSKLVK